MVIAKIPKLIQYLLYYFEFKIKGENKTLYLTFDDGPIPEVTPEVLDILDKYNAKATFFCVADNIKKHPEVFQSIIDRGHRLGNHTYHHIKGWETPNNEYFEDIERANQLVNSNLFRPPYGRIGFFQARELRKKYRLILWSVLSYDYSGKLSKENVWDNIRKSVTDNDIILFHDNIKARDNMIYSLSNTLFFYSKRGFQFKSIPL
ncbi:MAG: polysaccharide deacetylase family protein [Bacteroidales bacterium]|jgi:peptidoglycan/xylan/chitin deacetylase (PgdA/CDA1 family)|nr:polysaccharide deacetylase family protein [Bacteroidales bacterium]